MTTSIYNQIQQELQVLFAKEDELQSREWTKENSEQYAKEEELLSEAIKAIQRIKEAIENEDEIDSELIVRANY